MSEIQAGLLLLAILPVAYLLMWWGWRRRSRKHHLPPLVPIPDTEVATILQTTGRYFGTTVAGQWLDRVVAHGLGARASTTLRLSPEGLDVAKASGAFRIPAAALVGVRHDQGHAGKVVPPHGLLVVTWKHGDLTLDSGLRLENATTDAHNEWLDAIENLVKENA